MTMTDYRKEFEKVLSEQRQQAASKPETKNRKGSFWRGSKPEKCDLCDKEFNFAFVDGATKPTGQWAMMCPRCHVERGMGIGLGKGQLYILSLNRKVWEKIRG